MANKEMSFEDLILGQIPNQEYDQADFDSLPGEMRNFLGLLYSNPKDQITYIASDYYDKLITSSLIGWMGVVKTQDREGANALFIACQPSQPLQDVTLLEDIGASFKMLSSVLKPFLKIESALPYYRTIENQQL